MVKTLLLVGFGGFLGSTFRYLLSRFIALHSFSSIPFGTFTVNILGCFFIGILFGLSIKDLTSPELRMFLVIGFCGGFTTFSAFSLEIMLLMQNGKFGNAFLYSAGSVVAGLAALWLGLLLFKLK